MRQDNKNRNWPYKTMQQDNITRQCNKTTKTSMHWSSMLANRIFFVNLPTRIITTTVGNKDSPFKILIIWQK